MPSFKEAFAAARKSGKKEFSWNGKKYNTKLKEEVSVTKSPIPKKKPNKGPSVDSTPPKQPKNMDPIKPLANTSSAPKTSAKAPKPRPGMVDKLKMGSARRTGVNVSQEAVKMAEEKRKKAEAAKTATKGSPYKQISRYK